MDEEITIFDVADTFLSFESMTHKKLQKLCYYAQAYHLALNDYPLVNCKFQAWKHGPVCPELYREYKIYGHLLIPQKEMPEVIKKDTYVREFLEDIYDIFGRFSAKQLEYMTHNEEPWKAARGELEDWEKTINEITNESMKHYYKKFLEE